MSVLYANNAATILDTDVEIGDTSIAVVDGSAFPAPSGADYFWCTLETPDGSVREIVAVTANDGSTFTVIRAQQGFAAAAFSAGDRCELRWTQADADAVVSKILLIAKGDLVSASAAGTPSRIAVGTNGQVLVVDSSAPGGLSYSDRLTTAETALGLILAENPPLVTDGSLALSWQSITGSATTTITMTLGRTYAVPYYETNGETYTAAIIKLGSGSGASVHLGLAMFAPTATGLPGALLWHSAQLTHASNNELLTPLFSDGTWVDTTYRGTGNKLALPRGAFVWLGVCSDATPSIYVLQVGSARAMGTKVSPFGDAPTLGFIGAVSSGTTFPDPFAASAHWQTTPPYIGLVPG